ncbi:sterol 3beta-glucosyltransferase [Mobilisporobacter senegalensis]|uniref:Sterol 3beta-glucosyltransferase n=1 Tax=Mobilisporobacter senegalensis TaxID=1329262 RepID=A0A3N1XZI3_9FIRM|nr:glycosyltransferase [Mobilisporobacter senegalensis]ROR31651.1 sterol 3beta-glucosyltransferase [Mobilisporobacter senegalensis]
MKVTFLTLGTRGDVQPYVALGKELVKNGHEAVICTGETFRNFVEENQITFYPATADLMAIIKTPEGQAIFNGGGNPIKTMKYLKDVITPKYKKTQYDFLNATEGADIIIYHPKALAAVDIGEFRNIPCVCMPPVPMVVPIDEFPNLAFSPKGNFGPFINRLTYKITSLGLASYLKMINIFRAEELHLPKRKNSENYLDIKGHPIPVIYPISKELFKDVASWNGKVELPGFFYLENEEEILEDGIRDFIQSGSKPYVISFSSMPLKNPVKFMKMIEETLESLEERAIVITGASGMESSKSKRILSVPQVPHRLIFKESKGIIHHGGVGTVAEALLSGKPQFIIPFNVDQPFWAERLYRMGYALKPAKEKEITVELLKERLKEMEDSRMIQRMEVLQNILKEENGTQKAVRFLEEFVNRK